MRLGPSRLVTVVIPTRGRPKFLRQAIDYVMRQDWEPKEVLIINDGPQVTIKIPKSVRIFDMGPGRNTVGHKMNTGVRWARGSVIIRFDDDDWYGPHRITAQVEPIFKEQADITCLELGYWLDVKSMVFKKPVVSDKYRPLAPGDVAFTRWLWEKAHYQENKPSGEDNGFLKSCRKAGGRLIQIQNNGHVVYIRHGSNASEFLHSRQKELFTPASPPSYIPKTDLQFYMGLRGSDR